MKTLNDRIGNRGRWVVLAVVVVAAGLGLSSLAVAADPPGGKKMQRDIRSMERVIDDMLIDSPNFLVNSGKVCTGHYQPGVGAIFMFNTSLVSRWGGRSFHIGDLAFWHDDDEDHDWHWDDEDDWDDDDGKGSKSKRGRRARSEEKLYERGKEEIIEVLLDYGDRMKEMKGGDWIVVVSALRDSKHFRKNKMTRLVTKVKIDDLRAYGDDRLSEDAAKKKFIQEEY